MARFTDSQLKELKTNISLVALIQSQGHDLKLVGNDYEMCVNTSPKLSHSTG